jgi:hypothetical protein
MEIMTGKYGLRKYLYNIYLELLFLTVLALPNASNTGLD